jgi:hypothetical protein
MSGPCLCGDPECPRCFPGNDSWRAKQYQRALSQIANASARDYMRGESEADYWRRFAKELQADAREALENV